MKTTLLSIITALCSLPLMAQHSEVCSSQIRTLSLIVDHQPKLPPVLLLNGNNHIEIAFDDMTHEYHRYLYKVIHCDALWNPSQGIFESDYLEGFNNRPIEEYEKSFNTSLLYTHYTLTLPNKDLRMRLSGNYQVNIFEDGDEQNPVAIARFCVVEPLVGISMQVSSNTDVDYHKTHQQVTFSMDYAALTVTSALDDFTIQVMQNRRLDNEVTVGAPTMQNSQQLTYSHQRSLIFPAGNEFHKFEVQDVHLPAMGVDYMRWIDPCYHATLFPTEKAKNYVYDEDQDGLCWVRNNDGDDDIASEYVMFHFTHQSPYLPGEDVYLMGECTHHRLLPEYKMTYNHNTQAYELSTLLKQGYYNYQYIHVPSDTTVGQTAMTEGDFYETENEYSIKVYYHPRGSRYHRLVAFTTLHTE